MLSWDSIEQGLERFLALVRADPRVEAEFERSRGEFFVDPVAAGAPMAQLRHLEWFFLERPSPALGSTPVQAWQSEWRDSWPAAGAELAASLLHSIPGAFEVTAQVPAEGLWVRDLFTLGEHPVAEAEAMGALAAGDLLVGRLFPTGGGTFVLSPSVSAFRNPALLAAVRTDLEGMRAVRRGVLRIQQLELERIFHFHGGGGALAGEPAEVLARVEAELLQQGLEKKRVLELLSRVQTAARASQGQVITEILNGLAFETGVDLARVRLVLVELWDSERRGSADPESSNHFLDGASETGTQKALEAFDRGRAEGKDLEQLFRQLERDLGLEELEDGEGEEDEFEGASDSEVELAGAPDLPGVIAGLVEEFLWEVEREQGPERARAWGALRSLGGHSGDIGVLEELGPARLLDFSTRWLLDDSGLRSVPEVELLLEALTAFCVWCEDSHDLPLWTQFGPTLTALRDSLPRHVLLRQDRNGEVGAGPFRVVKVGAREALVSDGLGGERTVVLTPHQAIHLREGDLVRLTLAKGLPGVGATYPGELAESFFRSP